MFDKEINAECRMFVQYIGMRGKKMDNNNMYQQTPENTVQPDYQTQGQGVPQGGTYYQNTYQAAPVTEGPVLEEPVTMGEWLITMLLMLIPCVNIVLMFVWAFSKSEKKSKSNFFKAYLIWFAIWMGIVIVFWIVAFAGIISAMG